MIGIYLLTNLVNGKKYIGQSTDINRRFAEHLRAAQPDKYPQKNERDANCPIHKAMAKYGINNFSLTILEQCAREELDEKEQKWITELNTNDNSIGYNLTAGGQKTFALKGEKHSQAKLAQIEVNHIKQLLKETEMTLVEIMKIYPQVSKSTLSMINNGKIWTVEGETYPLRIMSVANKGEKNGRAKFSDEQVMEIRTKYSQGIAPKQIRAEYNDIATDAAINAILYGRTYKHLPIWNNPKKQWIEPCIDYPQSLK